MISTASDRIKGIWDAVKCKCHEVGHIEQVSSSQIAWCVEGSSSFSQIDTSSPKTLCKNPMVCNSKIVIGPQTVTVIVVAAYTTVKLLSDMMSMPGG